MRHRARAWVQGVVCCGICLLVMGCPVSVRLDITPGSADFGSSATELSLQIRKPGGGAVSWTITEVTRQNVDAPWTASNIPWLTVSPTQARQTGPLEIVTLTADRTGLRAGAYTNAGILVEAGNFSRVIPVSLIVQSTLSVSPPQVSLRQGATETAFRIVNSGVSSAAWTLRFIPENGDIAAAQPLPADIIASPASGTIPAGGTANVSLSWTQERSSFGILVDSPAGQPVFSVVFGAAITGLQVDPPSLTLFYDNRTDESASATQPASTLTIRNTGGTARSWAIQINDVARGGTTSAISATPSQGNTLPGEETTVEVRVTDPASVTSGSGNYELIIHSSDDQFIVVPLTLDIAILPVIEASDPPQPNTTRPEVTSLRKLDFGTQDVNKEFWVVNVGPLESDLYFRITHEDQGSETPLIYVNPLQGDTNGPDGDFFLPGTNFLIDGVPIQVTVDRSAMREDVEYRKITIEAWNADFTQQLTAVQPVEIEVRVERPPMRVEGAINRARPPYLMRFAFLLRDRLGQAIPTLTADDLSRLRFTLTEDDVPMDWNETSQFVLGAEHIRTNLVLLLDFTGSLYYSGVNDPVNPRRPGEVLEEVRAAALRFLDDLPENYKVALMYHCDRQQKNRLIHPFTTDRNALKNALAAFYLPPAMHGVTAVWDAVEDAVNRIVAADPPDTLPFDDADVRAIVLVTDGKDNASAVQPSTAIGNAKDNRVRLYSLTYGDPNSINLADLLTAADDTGGYVYRAADASGLVQLLGNVKGLVLEPVTSLNAATAQFNIVNAGATDLNWEIASVPNWLTVTPASGSLVSGESITVSVTANPAAFTVPPPLRAAEATLQITSNNGSGYAKVRTQFASDMSAVESIALVLTDEPGRVWQDLRNQLLFTYITPSQRGGTYSIRAEYTQPDGSVLTAIFEEDGVFYPGDVLAGQISTHTTGIVEDLTTLNPLEAVRAEAYVRLDYAPRNVSKFRFRIVPMVPLDLPAAAAVAFSNVQMQVEIAPGGLADSTDPYASTWRLVNEGSNRYLLLTEQNAPLTYGASGELLRVKFTGLKDFVDACLAADYDPLFYLDLRVDNQLYYAPGTPTRPSQTVYFQYPNGPTNPGRLLSIGLEPDLAGAAATAALMAFPGIDPDTVSTWDQDGDGVEDFMDPYPADARYPGGLITPSVVDLSAGPVTVTLTNNRLDAFTWSLSVEDLPGTFPENAIAERVNLVPDTGGDTPLLPGTSTTFQVSLDSNGLPNGTYEGLLVVTTDVFGAQRYRLVYTRN